jgi:hypothetical protein
MCFPQGEVPKFSATTKNTSEDGLKLISFAHHVICARKSIFVVSICDMLELCSELCCPHALRLPSDKL